MTKLLTKLITSVVGFSLASCSQPVSSQSSGCQNPNEPIVYVAASATDSASLKRLRSVFHHIAGKDGKQIIIDGVVGDKVVNQYSNQPKRRITQGLANKWEIAPTTAVGLVASLDRLQTLAKAHPKQAIVAYLLSAGTSDSAILSRLKYSANGLKTHTCLSVRLIGIEPANRLMTSESFAPIRDRVRFASDKAEEWMQVLE
jgi:hypothetical protein